MLLDSVFQSAMNFPHRQFLPFVVFISCVSATCPLWTQYNESSGNCQCGSGLNGLVNCKYVNGSLNLQTLYCFCMTFNQEINQVTVGRCPFNCHTWGVWCPERWEIMSKHIENVTSEICGGNFRTGHLCGDCIQGYGLPVYSFSLRCVRCRKNDFKYNLAKYILCTYFPLTVLYILLVIGKVSISSHKLSGFVFVCQVLTIPSLL